MAKIRFFFAECRTAAGTVAGILPLTGSRYLVGIVAPVWSGSIAAAADRLAAILAAIVAGRGITAGLRSGSRPWSRR
ncbi:MAG: hypothetical protein E7055_11070 [Lentisphaerae bacterium]|nr:hypothetical protein [Lentisphaerota bacterium]